MTKKQVHGFMKYFSFSFLWAFFQWLYRWRSVKTDGVVAGLVGCGLIKLIVSISSDLMHNFKTGHLTFTSSRSMLLSQAIATGIGCVVAPLTFFLFYEAFEVGNPNGNYKAPYALIYRNMAILSKPLHKYSLRTIVTNHLPHRSTQYCTTTHATPPYYNKETFHSTQHIHNMDHDMGMAAPPPSTMVMMKRRHFMHMTFFWGTKSEVLFDQWPGDSRGMYALALLFVFVMSFLVEWLSHTRFMKPGSNKLSAGLCQTVLHLLRVGLAYLVMLALMSFNAGVFLMAVLGHALGFFFFGSRAFAKPHNG
ncbi:hypothetical protein HN51_010133 [Arachis hypogaea]